MTVSATEPVSHVYVRSGERELSVDVFRPRSTGRGAAVLVLHGGAWRFGSPADVHERAAALADDGFTAIAVQYSLLDVGPWPTAFDDVAAALTWVRDHADSLGIEPDRVIVQGHSAGAHLALMTGTLPVEQRPAAIVAYYPPIGFYRADQPANGATPPVGGPPRIELDELGRVPSRALLPAGATQTDIDEASPISLVDRSFPPTIVLHGSQDSMVHVRSSLALYQRLLELGVSSDLHVFADRDHEFDRAPLIRRTVAQTVVSFLERTVTDTAESGEERRRYKFAPGTEG